MKITVGDKVLELDIDETLKVKHLRKIYPLINKHGDDEIEMICQICIALGGDSVEDTIDAMSMEEFTELSTIIAWLLDTKKK